MKDLSIIIVNLNNKKILDECLASIYKNTKKINFETIVSDNGSSDGTQEMVKTRYPQVKLIKNGENLGFVKGNNIGLKQAEARYSILLNNDTMVKESALDKMVEFMDANPAVGACGPKLLNIDGTVQRQGGVFGKKFWKSQKALAVDFVIGAALLVRKEVIDRVGMMDENLFFYNEDLDWCMTIRKAGYKVCYLPQAEIIHYGGFSSKKGFNKRLLVEGFKGGLYFCRKHYGEVIYNIYRLLLILGLILILPFLLNNPEKFKAYCEIIAIAWRGQIPKAVLK
ncbi:MAG: glycosyltransferase family 2 protein [Candidatus Margulisiibacteriota bacterium]|nr:glycosyltransferase family 2 protein [Candidatus Margulisiibacteriota bacterium]